VDDDARTHAFGIVGISFTKPEKRIAAVLLRDRADADHGRQHFLRDGFRDRNILAHVDLDRLPSAPQLVSARVGGLTGLIIKRSYTATEPGAELKQNDERDRQKLTASPSRSLFVLNDRMSFDFSVFKLSFFKLSLFELFVHRLHLLFNGLFMDSS
jgi:hypothetical protein